MKMTAQDNLRSILARLKTLTVSLAMPVAAMCLLGIVFASSPAYAEETACASVKIEIKQELTLERQAFDAEMKINNTTDSSLIEDVSVVVKVTDELGAPVAITDDPNNTSAKFFIRVTNKENINNVDGSGVVNPASTAIINWLLIPAPGSAGENPLGKKYLVGATLKYKFGGEETILDISPDVITVKPLPLLTLDYFLTQDVVADDPLTAPIEASEPFTLGVRVKNTGFATAKNLKIDSAQPKIIENNQGLLIGFKLTGSYVDDAPTQNTLLTSFGDIVPNTSKMGRWTMETTLAGKFTEFTVRFTHADELGGTLTSILQAANAHFLIRDVRVDLPGRDAVRDFLAQDGDVIRVYESDGPDTVVTDRSNVATLTATTNSSGNAVYRLNMPVTAGFAYARLPDPFGGQKALGKIARSDAKVMLAENVWLSKTRNSQTKQWQYWVNFFDTNSTGVYEAEFQAPPIAAQPPQIQFIPDHVIKEEQPVSFLVEASSPDSKPVTISAAPLPTGATLTPQPADPPTPGLTSALLDWTPPKGSVGNYLIVYTAADGTLSATRSASIRVETNAPPPGPGTPTIDSPVSGAEVTTLKPDLRVLTSTNPQDPTTKVQFEIYKDEAMTQLADSALVNKVVSSQGVEPTVWQPTNDLMDNTVYWWRARAFDGAQTYSLWANGHFKVNLFNDPPDNFNLTSPAANTEVATLQPVLTWTNAVDKDGDAITYGVAIYTDAALTELVTEVAGLSEGTDGSTSWTVVLPLSNHVRYYWKVIARDALGAQTPGIARYFEVNTGNTAPTAPTIVSPAIGSQSHLPATVLTIQNSTDAENDLITYVFEIDTVNTFDSSDKRSSGQIIQNTAGNTSWTTPNLVENQRYWWRVKSQDGSAESAWVMGEFLMSQINEAPPMPTVKNPGNAAWVASQQPSFEANPVTDPEGDAVRYQFEVYHDAALTQKVIEGISTNTGWIPPVALADKTTYWWRLRALDEFDAASAWTAATIFYVSTGPYQDPTIEVTTPTTPVAPDIVTTQDGARKQVTIRWQGTNLNIEPTIALYYATSNTGYAGNVIVDGLRQVAGVEAGSYVWDVTNLALGTYYIYGVIYDAKSLGRAYAPGAVIIANPAPAGRIVVTADADLHTTENGGTTTFKVRLDNAPTAQVTVPISSTDHNEGVPQPTSLVFTPQNWMTDQTVTVTGQNDCVADGNKAYQVLSGQAVTVDPNYIGLTGTPVNIVNNGNPENAGDTNNPNIHICGFTIETEQRLDPPYWEYTLKAILTNTGSNVGGVTAKLNPTSLAEIIDNTIQFGAVNTGESAGSNDTITVRARRRIPAAVFRQGKDFTWNITVQP